jgi:hypothetical protein
MVPSRAFLIALLLSLSAPSAFAQGMDDLLAPLTPSPGQSGKGKGKGKTKTSKRRAAKPKKGSKQKAAPVAEPEEEETTQSVESDLLAPLVKKTELLVKVGGGVRGARLFVDHQEVGTLPRGTVEVPPGEHTIVVRRPGYRDFSRRVSALEGEVTEVGVLLEAVAGFVSVKADVEGARVFINGEDKGTVPLEGLTLPPGSYEIVVQREGFRPETQRISVRVGKEYTVDVNLRPEAVASDQPRAPNLTPRVSEPSPLTQEPPTVAASTPLTQRWYFWAGVGAVVTAAAVGTVVATQPQPLNPSTVCGGQCDAVINSPVGVSPIRF